MDNDKNINDDQIKSFYGDADISLPDELMVPETEDAASYKVTTIEDDVAGSFKFCFLGAGQGGSRIAEAFSKIGYNRTAVINTAQQDLNSIKLEDKNKLCVGAGVAGKDPEVARKLLDEKKEDVLS